MHYEKFADGSEKCIEGEILFEIPDTWIFVRLKHIGSIIGGGTPKTNNSAYWDGEIPWLTPADLSGYRAIYVSAGKRNITREGLDSSSARLMPKGTVLYSSRAPIGYVAISANPIATNQGFKSIVPYDFSTSKYLYYCLQARTPDIVQRATGTTFKEISGSAMGEIIIPLPPQEEQNRIVAFVDALLKNTDVISAEQTQLYKLIRATKAQILDLAIRGKLVSQDPNDEPASVLLERIREEKEALTKQGKLKRDKKESIIYKGDDNSYYEKVGSRVKNIDDQIPFDLPDGWIWCRGYSCFEGMENTKPQGEFFDYIDIDAIDNRSHCIRKAKHIPVSEAPSRASRVVKEGSVLFSLVRPYLENIALIKEENRHCIASTGFYVCNSNGVFLPEFMFFLMISGYVVDGLNQFMKGDNSPSISKDNIENWIYPIPPIREQQAICLKVKEEFSVIRYIEINIS